MFVNGKSAVLALALASLPAGVQAQGSGSELDLEEVIVTARKRAESVQDIPLAITPFQTEQLLRRDIQTVEDLATNTVGLSYNQGVSSGVQGSATIRGLATNFLQDRFQNVGVYLDGVYLQRQSMMNIGMVDLARIEVVKGPQNALYGRNAFAGAINYVTRKPSEDFEAYLLTTQGSDEREDYRAAFGGTLIEGALYGRVVYGISAFDGANDNPHPFDDADVPGFHNEGKLGGWDDETLAASLVFTPAETVEIGAAYYNTDIRREFQSSYIINGIQEVAAFGTSRYDDMNFNRKTLQMRQGPILSEFTGYTLFEGALPETPGPGRYAGPGMPVEDRAIFGAVDPRGFGARAETELVSVSVNWDIDYRWNLRYQFGYVEHDSLTSGPAQRDALEGSTYSDIARVIRSSDFSSRPNSALDTGSHELRLEWAGGDRLSVSGGLYYAQTDDESHDLTVFAPPCSDRDLNGNGSADDEIANCNLRVVPGVESPLDDVQFLGILDFFNRHWNGQRSNWTRFDDEITAVFAEATYNLTDELKLRLEARYTEEEREVVRLTDNFALAPGQVGTGSGLFGPVAVPSNIVIPEDDETFDYFTPRLSVDWAWRDGGMVYAYAAKGVKSGGFNNSTAVVDLTYDEEENWTFEIGSKNVLFDNRLTLNGALFYVDWSNIQGALSPTVQSQNSNVVIGNIGDATNLGFEIEGVWRFDSRWSVDFGYTWIDPEYDDAEYDAARRYYYYNCPLDVIPPGDPNNPGQPFLCGDADVDGNQLSRTSKHMAIGAVNYAGKWFDGWTVSARLDVAYQSRQYLTPLNVGYIDERTLANGSVNLVGPGGRWDVTVWGKNLSDEEYVQGVFVTSLFTNMLVAGGQGRTWGVTLKYNL